MTFQNDDECIVTGDTAGEGHCFRVGEKVTLREKDGRRALWRCEGASDWWWVNEADLELMDLGPTDQEVLAVFGLAPEFTDADYLRKLAADERVPTTIQKEIIHHLNT